MARTVRTAIAYLQTDRLSADADERVLLRAERLDVVGVVRDGRGQRSGLVDAVGRVAAGEATALLVARLGEVASSLRELVDVLAWLHAADVELVALDVGLDTSTPAGLRIATVLREVARLEREPQPGRPVRGRPGLAARTPELGERITAMREAGLSLQAIADTLNADGVPTQRGGALWRPSSVQAALGYRRPRPPLPGAPVLPPRPVHHDPPGAGHPPAGPTRPPRGPGRPRRGRGLL